MTTQYIIQETSTCYSQRSSTTGYCSYNLFVYPPHQQKLYVLSFSTTCSYSPQITTTRALPVTNRATLCTVFPPFNQFFSYLIHGLPFPADATNSLINAVEFTLPPPCINDYLVNNYPDVLKREIAFKLKL